MKKLWQIFWNEYRRHVFRRRFILILLSLPGSLLLALLAAGVASLAVYSPRPVGYVDQGGWLSNPIHLPAEGIYSIFNVRLQPYPDEDSAMRDLKAGRLQGFYVLPSDYLKTGEGRLVVDKRISPIAESGFRDFLRANLLSSQPQAVAHRVTQGMQLTRYKIQNGDESRTPTFFALLGPILAGFILILLINSSSGYLVQAITDEKENRTMEILATSVSEQQLMVGKTLGSLSVGLTQMVIWFGFPLLLFLVIRRQLFSLLDLSGNPLPDWISILAVLGGFVLVSACMAGIGSVLAESREAQQVSSLLTMPVMVPFMVMVTFVNHPDGPIARALSYFPLTSPLALPLRAAFTTVPTWEILLSLGLLYLTAGLALWLAGRAFRLGMLRYNKSVQLKELFGKRLS